MTVAATRKADTRRSKRKVDREVGVAFGEHQDERAVQHVGDGDRGHSARSRQTPGSPSPVGATSRPRLAPSDSRSIISGSARGAARQQQVRQVRARNQHQHTDAGHERRQRVGEARCASTKRRARRADLRR